MHHRKKKRRRVASLCLQKIFFKKQQKEDFKKSKKILTFSISNVMYNSAHFIFLAKISLKLLRLNNTSFGLNVHNVDLEAPTEFCFDKQKQEYFG